MTQLELSEKKPGLQQATSVTEKEKDESKSKLSVIHM